MFDHQDNHVIEGEIIDEQDDVILDDDLLDVIDEVENPGRRSFLSRVLLGGAVAAALGGGAGVVYNRQMNGQPEVVVLPNGDVVASTQPQGVAVQDGSGVQMQAALQSVTADRDRLQDELNLTNSELDETRRALQEALAELDAHRGLNSLWQQLDDVGLDAVTLSAMGVVTGNMGNLARVAGLLKSGLEVGHAIVDWFLASIPGPQNGILWLQLRVESLATSIDWLMQKLGDNSASTNNFGAVLTDFVLWVLERLPFGMGDRAEEGLNAMKTVMSDLPELVRGVNETVLNPLAAWFGTDETQNLKGVLVNPVLENVFDPAHEVLTQFEALQTAYTDELEQPAQAALSERQTLRAQIREAQSDLGMTA